MTLFVIILVMFIMNGLDSHQKRKNKINSFAITNKSNAQLQYNTACEITEKMAKSYREFASKTTLKEHLSKSYPYLSSFNINTIANLQAECNFELAWLYVTSKACGMELNDISFQKIYRDNVWGIIPSILTKEFIAVWKSKFKPSMTDKALKDCLNSSIALKQKILNENEFGSYSAYNNANIIEQVAIKFGMPNYEELKSLGSIPYASLLDLIRKYSQRKVINEGFCSVTITDIRPTPTDEQKEKQYRKLSDYEQRCQDNRKDLEVYRKYFK